MEKMNHILEIAKHSHHMPALLSLLFGLLVIRKNPHLLSDDENIGDNIPLTLIDSLKE